MFQSRFRISVILCVGVLLPATVFGADEIAQAGQKTESDGAELEDPTEPKLGQEVGEETVSEDSSEAATADNPDLAEPIESVEAVAPVLAPDPAIALQLANDVARYQNVLSYADHLFWDGDWYRAIGEYRRYLYLIRGRGPEAPRAAIAIGEALLRGQQLDAAGRQLDGVAQRTSDLFLRRVALFGAARSYLLDGRPELSKPRFRLIAEDEESPPAMRREATWLLAWGHFDAGEFDRAEEYFSQLAQAEGSHSEDSAGIVTQLGLRAGLSKRNPILAGALSLIPGLGHMYLGQWSVGLTSLGWNALFTFAAVTAWLQGQWGVALVLTVMEVSWYSGGIFGALAGTIRYNRDVVRNWRDQILADYGASREMPAMHLFPSREEHPPGSAPRFGVPF